MQKDQFLKYKILAFLFVSALIIFRIFSVSIYDEGKGRSFVRGDAHSDINTHSAAKYFYDYGFTETAFLPVHHYDHGISKDSIIVYTHYPAFPDIMAGIYAYLFQSTDERVLRTIPFLIGSVWFWLMFIILGDLLKNKTQAFIGGILLVLSNYYINWVDTFHKHLYEEMIQWILVWLLYKYYESKKENRKLLLIIFPLMLILVNTSFEPVTYIAVIVIGFSYIYEKKIFSTLNIALGLTVVFGFFLHLWQNAIYFGGWDLMAGDMKASLLQRTMGEGDNEMGSEMKLINYIESLYLWIYRFDRVFYLPGFFFVLLTIAVFRNVYQTNKKLFQILTVILLASFSWNIAMPQHTNVHFFTVKHMGILFGLVAGIGLPIYYKRIKEDFNNKKTLQATLHVIIIGYIFIMEGLYQVFDTYIKYGFGYSFFNSL